MLVGIDVAKAELVVGTRPAGERWTVANDEGGVRTLLERLTRDQPELIVLEATGGYELLAVAALGAAGLALVATKRNAVIRARYLRLLAAGKPKKLALVACMRKLLTLVRTKQRWSAEIGTPALQHA
jgi:transposase